MHCFFCHMVPGQRLRAGFNPSNWVQTLLENAAQAGLVYLPEERLWYQRGAYMESRSQGTE